MSSMAMVQANPKRVGVPVARREPVWEAGAIISIKVPSNAVRRTYEDDTGTEHAYVEFYLGFKGHGFVGCFLHTDDASCVSHTIVCQARLMQKTLMNGRAYLYVDLLPIPEHVEGVVTHQMAIRKKGEIQVQEGWQAFDTPPPLHGQVIFYPPEADILAFLMECAETPPKPAPAIKKPPSEDPQLDRLLEAGWRIKSQDALTAILVRDDGKGGERTMAHRKPVKKVRKK